MPDARPLFQEVRGRGKKIGVAINPGTPVEAIDPYLPDIDLALCMTVWPGFGGQAFLPESPARIAALRGLIARRNPACELEVDGGIDLQTAPTCGEGRGHRVRGRHVDLRGQERAPRATVELARVVQA